MSQFRVGDARMLYDGRTRLVLYVSTAVLGLLDLLCLIASIMLLIAISVRLGLGS